MELLKVQANDWVRLSAELFAPVYSPTIAVQRLTQRLLTSDASEEVPAVSFLKACLEEFTAARNSQSAKTPRKPKSEPLAKLFYKRPSGILNLPPRSLPTPPQKPPRKAPASFDILAFGKSPFQEPRLRTPVMETDEELFRASTDEEALARACQMPRKFATSVVLESSELQRYREENEYLLDKCGKTEAALEESISFCDQVSVEHDLLLQQNAKLKRLLSVVTDRLVRANPTLLKDLDFTDVLNDPCKEFRPTGILKQLEDDDEPTELSQEPAPQSPSFSPKHYIGSVEEEEILIAILPNQSTHPKMLSFPVGARILKLGEAQGWLLGEEISTGRKGYFPPTCVTHE